MSIAARQILAVGEEKPKFLSWLQSNGNGYVDTGFAPSSINTRILISASYTQTPTTTAPLVFAGCSVAVNANDDKVGFGFSPVFNDRQIYFRVGKSRWWNNRANTGNWKGGTMTNIEVGLISETAATGSKDGSTIAMVNEGSTSTETYPRVMPTESQVIFGSKSGTAYSMVNSIYKVRRVAYSLNGTILADFNAARLGSVCGFYDIVNNLFCPGVGTFSEGSVIEDFGSGGGVILNA